MSSKFQPLQSVENDGLIIPEVGNWGERKYKLVGHYCNIFTSAMKGKWNLIYIDLFAGAGLACIKETKRIVKSSALISLTVPKPFDYYVFNELDKEKYLALEKRITKDAPHENYKVYNLDANAAIETIIKSIPAFNNGKGNLMFCFLDPFSLNLKFSTVAELAKYKVDILMLMALQMDGKRNFKVYLQGENKRIENFLGHSDWRDKFEKEYQQGTFIKYLSDQYDENMSKLGYHVEYTKEVIKTDSGLGLYYMAFYSKHPLGNNFFKKVNVASNDQLSMF